MSVHVFQPLQAERQQQRLAMHGDTEELAPAASWSSIPPVSALSVALSRQYLSTFALLLSVVAAWSAVSELLTPTGFESPAELLSAVSWLRYSLSEELEHLLDVLPVLSILMLRHFSADDASHLQQEQHGGCRAVLSAAVTPTGWTVALAVLFWLRLLTELLKLPYYNSPAHLSSHWVWLLFPSVLSLKAATAAYLLRIFACTQPHPPRRQAQPHSALGAGWTACAVVLLLLAVILSPLYEIVSLFMPRQAAAMTYDNLLLDRYGGLVEELMMAALLLLGLAGLLRARSRIAQGGVQDDLFCFVLLAAFQLCLPKYLYEGFVHWLPLYQSCSSALWLKLTALLLFHVAFFLLQLCLRLLTLLCLPSAHCLPALFYLQWFEDLMADLTFASVPPFSPLFWLNAALAAIKVLVRDTGVARDLVSQGFCSAGASGRAAHNGSRAAVINFRDGISAAEPSRSLLTADTERCERPRSGCAAVLWQRYVLSFELHLSRHQLFLSESCAKVVVATAVLCQLFRPVNAEQPSGWTMVSDDKPRLLAGMAVLWIVQLLAHVAVLRILRARRPRPVHRVLLTHDDAVSSGLVSDSSDAARPVCSDGGVENDGCSSCVLSYPNYIAALAGEKRRDEQQGAAAAVSTGDGRPGWLSAVFFPRLSPIISPLLNYWTAHRWLLICQMLHWIWVVLADNSFAHTTCT